MWKVKTALIVLLGLLAACGEKQAVSEKIAGNELKKNTLSHLTPYIPPQCYTNPVDEKNNANNPCYICHTSSVRPNYFNDGETQLSYSFPEPAYKNHWSNLFADRRVQVAAISDADIKNYVNQDNYLQNGKIVLAEKLKNVPQQWDYDNNGQWSGYTPDSYFNFDQLGFDHNPDGSYTGWRAYAYAPLPGTFMPTNGSTDDVLIRLPASLQQNNKGEFDQQVYMVNLAVLEAMINEQDININEVDETIYGVDLNKNGKLDKSTFVKYDWAPLKKRFMSYVGMGKTLFDKGELKMAARLYPVGTEFIHSVRYLAVSEDNQVGMAKRMKELRYARKTQWQNYNTLQTMVDAETKERHDFPSRTRTLFGNIEAGTTVPQGWIYQGFIEDAAGDLRPQTFEENAFCVGCHSGLGALTDTVFSMQRKFKSDSFQQGWYHWFQKSLAGTPEPKRADGEYEYSFYLKNNPSGNEFRTNDELRTKFFNADGSQKAEAFAAAHEDLTHLIMPSAARALLLNKTYRSIVQEQSFIKGRDPILQPLTTVHKEVELEADTGVKQELSLY